MEGNSVTKISNELIVFVRKLHYDDEIVLTRSTDLKKDLRLKGDDAIEFLESFLIEFNIDGSQFRADKYIEGEGQDLLGFISKLFKGRTDEPMKIITLGKLDDAISSGKLE